MHEHPHESPAPGGPAMEDEAVAAEARRGSRSAFALLVERHAGGVLGLLEHRVGDREEARDLAQDVWVKVLGGLAGYDPRRAFRPWLYGIVLNHLRDRFRRRERSPLRGAAPLDGDARQVAGPARLDPSGRIEERAAIEGALARVGEPFRTALLLVDVLGLDHAEASAALGCAPGTIKSRVSRGRAGFRAAYLELSGETPRELGGESPREEPAPPELPPAARTNLALP